MYHLIWDLANELIIAALFLKVWVISGKNLFKNGCFSTC